MVGSQRACKRCFAAVEASPHRELFYPFPAAPTPVPAPAQPEAEEVHEAKVPPASASSAEDVEELAEPSLSPVNVHVPEEEVESKAGETPLLTLSRTCQVV